MYKYRDTQPISEDPITQTGSIVTIDNTDDVLALHSLVADINPIQSLNGYDKPWSGGAGKNLVPLTLENIKSQNISGVWSDNVFTTRGVTFTVNLDDAGNVESISATGTPTASIYFFLSDNIEWKAGQRITSGITSGGNSTYGFGLASTGDWCYTTPRTISSDVSTKCAIWYGTAAGTVNHKWYPMIVASTETDLTYEPYSNICPISGYDSVVVNRCGKNLLVYPHLYSTRTTNGITFTSNSDGSVTVNGTATATAVYTMQVTMTLADGTYILSGGKSASRYIGLGYFASDSATSETRINNTTISGAQFTSHQGRVTYIQLVILNGQTVNNEKFYPMIRLASETDATYEPYQGETYTTDLGRTVYGGTLDVVSGVLTVTDANIASYNGETLPSTWISDRDVYSSGTTPTTGAQVVYKLSTPQTYQLTPQQISLLLGENHLWSDGEITLTYGVHPYYNPTPFESKPLIKVTGTGTLGIGEYILTITGTASQTLYIDCETMEIYTLEETVPTGASSLVSINKNDFPVLEPGTNYISVGSGITAVTITPRWWRI